MPRRKLNKKQPKRRIKRLDVQGIGLNDPKGKISIEEG